MPVPSGSVSIVDQNNNVLLTETLDSSGNATGTFTAGAPGTYTVTAEYSGDSNFNAGSSQPITFVVNSAKQNVTVNLSLDPNPANQGDSITAAVNVAAA